MKHETCGLATTLTPSAPGPLNPTLAIDQSAKKNKKKQKNLPLQKLASPALSVDHPLFQLMSII